MTDSARLAADPPPARRPVASGSPLPRVVFTHRDDPLVPYLRRALAQGFDVVDEARAELSATERLVVAAATLRPILPLSRERWGERYIKSRLGLALRSRRVQARLARSIHDVVFQTHALYRVDGPGTVMYVDCTHRQSTEHWPAWNPLRGRALRRWLAHERSQYHAAAHVFAFSQATRRSLTEDYGVPGDRVTVVGAGVDFAELPVLESREPGAAPVLLLVGNDFVRKGGPELLRAFAKVRAVFPEARLQLVGSGCPEVQQDGVEVLGAVGDRRRLSEIYAGASVFCLPSHFEPFGLVLLEAMAHGLPCVGTDSCGIPDVVRDGVTGAVVPLGGDLADDLATTLIDLLSSPERLRRWGLAGRARVEEEFLWSHVVERMRPAIQQICHGDAQQGVPAPAPNVVSLPHTRGES